MSTTYSSATTSVSGRIPGRVTVPSIIAQKRSGQRICALTAYDYTMARLIDRAGVDIILVGDSVGSIVQGQETTIPVTLDQMVYHTRCVSRGVERALLVGDLPFLSYQVSPEQAIVSAGRLLQEGGAHAVKLEGGEVMASTIARLVSIGIPVMAHIGLTPQSYHQLGGHKRQGKTDEARQQILRDAAAVADAGAFAVVLECIPAALAEAVTNSVSIPTIGIGAGEVCDGEILVSNDLVGLRDGPPPSFVTQRANVAGEISNAITGFCDATRGVRRAAQVA